MQSDNHFSAVSWGVIDWLNGKMEKLFWGFDMESILKWVRNYVNELLVLVRWEMYSTVSIFLCSWDCTSWYISIVKAIWCSFFFKVKLNVTVHVSVSLSVHHQESKTVLTALGICHTGMMEHLVPTSKQATNLYDVYLKLYVQSWTPDVGRRDRPKHVEWYLINLKKLWVWLVFYWNSQWVCESCVWNFNTTFFQCLGGKLLNHWCLKWVPLYLIYIE
jgi:hypothetical protein